MKKKPFWTDNPLCQVFLAEFTAFLQNYLKSLPCLPFRGHRMLKDSIAYTLFSGGKYFRPLLTLATAKWAGVPTKLILPWAGALEMAHSASLIHDDLPCMDNSPIRRGRPANHRVFGEGMALLAGNSLWVEAFRLIINTANEKQAKLWLPLLSDILSFNNLMGGQALDLKVELQPDYHKNMHWMKTGQLISASMQGVALLPSVKKEQTLAIQKISVLIGRAFQIADDLQDAKTEKTPSNFVFVTGQKSAQGLLQKLSDQALKLTDPSAQLLKELILFNKNRGYPESC